jgi:hypothetical protein
MLLLVLILASVVSGIDNGLGITPPRGWRSWNCFGNDVYDSRMRSIIDAMVDRSRSVNGKPTSLVDMGYITCGLDDNWQACGTGVDGSFHDASGNPLINLQRFPDMKSLCDYAHGKGAKMGWYHNNCDCSENQKWNSTYVDAHYHGDVNAIVGYGFDEVKLDGCGEFLNLTYWAQLLNETKRPVIIENCHWGGDVPTQDWCPFNFFRTSGDINPSWSSWFSNLQTTIKFLDYNNPLSRPGCWAYPDMLEVGNMGNYNEERAHFGGWVIVSAPLILGFDLTDQTKMNRVWDIITNTEAIAVSEAWVGHPGMLLKSWDPVPPANVLYLWAVDCNASDPTQVKYAYDSATKLVTYSGNGGSCVDYSNSAELIAAKCGSGTQSFTYDTNAKTLKASNGNCVDVNNFQGPVMELWGCNGGCNQQWNFNSDGTWSDNCSGGQPKKCVSAKSNSPFTGNALQLWGKPTAANGAMAVLLINNDPSNAYVVNIDFSLLNITGKATVRDIWNHKDLGTFQTTFTTDSCAAHDSRFYLFTPTA